MGLTSMATTKIAFNKPEHYPHGAYISLEELIGARYSAKNLNLQQRRRALSLLTGPNKTSFRGRGIDFEEVRNYQAGDDIRTIDWRVTARIGKAYTKLFQEEREQPILIVTDQRQPMFFGSQHCFKSVTATYLSALIAWSGLQNGDRVGGLVFGNNSHREIRPQRSRKSVLAFIHLLTEYNQQLNRNSLLEQSAGQSLEKMLLELRRIAKPGTAIYLISDYAGFHQSDAPKQLHQLAKHCEITAMMISDPLERELPLAGQYTVSDGHQRRLIDTGPNQIRRQYKQQFEQQRERLQQDMARLGVPLIEIGTDQAPLVRLQHYFGNSAGAVVIKPMNQRRR